MQIVSHRGNWKMPADKNSLRAFQRAFEQGFGIELDVRDSGGRLVVAHDPPSSDALGFEEVLTAYGESAKNNILAVNIKADGLHALISAAAQRHGVHNYFVFDMSVPDMRSYASSGLPFFSRHSDVESNPIFYADATGVWLDAFFTDWIDQAVIAKHMANRKKVCLVSSELHGRDHGPLWTRLRSMPRNLHRELMLCTDHPELAREFFHE